MLTAVKGIYKDGVARPVEKVELTGPRDVLSVFQAAPESEPSSLLRAAGTWADLDPEALT